MSSTDVADASILKWTSTDRAPGALRIDGSVTLSDIAVADLREDAVTFPGTAVPLLVLRISPARPAAMRSSGGLLVLELLPAAATSEARATHAAFAKSVMSVCSSVRGGASASYGLPTAMGAGSASTTPVQSPVADRVNGWADARGGASSMQVPSAMRSLSSLRATPIGGSLSALLAARGR
ncbi:hypothetical protein EON62_05110 [archaeon]|nr:MAG: hypothetical protein EON62_05110 [archaeon]